MSLLPLNSLNSPPPPLMSVDSIPRTPVGRQTTAPPRVFATPARRFNHSNHSIPSTPTSQTNLHFNSISDAENQMPFTSSAPLTNPPLPPFTSHARRSSKDFPGYWQSPTSQVPSRAPTAVTDHKISRPRYSLGSRPPSSSTPRSFAKPPPRSPSNHLSHLKNLSVSGTSGCSTPDKLPRPTPRAFHSTGMLAKRHARKSAPPDASKPIPDTPSKKFAAGTTGTGPVKAATRGVGLRSKDTTPTTPVVDGSLRPGPDITASPSLYRVSNVAGAAITPIVTVQENLGQSLRTPSGPLVSPPALPTLSTN
ncbi:hypothetical protein M427DRAFT_53170, partial [Gonapodya prolifera JEL478]